MVLKSQLDIEGLVQEDRVHRHVFTDPAIFELELEQIFYRTWVYVAHESEVAQGGDYKTTCIGRQPVIVTRDPDDGQVYVLYNRCRHRGATVCQYEYGTSTYFRCAYHSWTYNSRGELVGVPFPKGYGETFDLREFGLVQVPRVASYRGFLFASLSPEGPSLEEHLGNARLYLDLLARRGEVQLRRLGISKVGYNGNWKLQVDNNIDSYHVAGLHKSWLEIHERRSGVDRTALTGRMRDLGNGHGSNEMDLDPLEPGYDPRKDPLRSWQLSVFPNLAVQMFPYYTPQVRVVRPVAVDRTEVWYYPFYFPDIEEEQRLTQVRWYEEFYGPAGVGGPDDLEVFQRVQRGLQCQAIEWVLLSRDMQNTVRDERGIQTDPYRGEAGQRGFYRHWKRLMTTDER